MTTTGRQPAGSRPVRPSGLGVSVPLVRVLLVLALVSVAALGAASFGPWATDVAPVAPPGPEISTAEPVTRPPEPTDTQTPEVGLGPLDSNAWLVAVTVLLGALSLIALGRWLSRAARAWRESPRGPEPEPSPELLPEMADAAPALAVDELQDAVTQALEAIDAARDAHDAVIAAWLVLERAAERTGVPRDPAQSPSEFARAVLAATNAHAPSADALLRLYLRVRFGTAPTTAKDVSTARDALRRLTTDLSNPPRSPA